MNKGLQTLLILVNLGLTVVLILIIWGPIHKLDTGQNGSEPQDQQITKLQQELKQYDFDRKRQYEELKIQVDSLRNELSGKIASIPSGEVLARQIKNDTEKILAAQAKPLQLPSLFELQDMIRSMQQSLGNLSLPLDGILKTLNTYNNTNSDFLKSFEKLNTILQMQRTTAPIGDSSWLDKLGEYVNIGGRVYRLSPATQMEYRFSQITSGIIFDANRTPEYLKKDGKLYKLTDAGTQTQTPPANTPGGIVPDQQSWLPLPETKQQIDRNQRDLDAITQELERFKKEMKKE